LLPALHEARGYKAKCQAVQRVVPVGMPLEQAQAALEAQGFKCEAQLPGGLACTNGPVPDRVRFRLWKAAARLHGSADRTPPGDWHLENYHVWVAFDLDDNHQVRGVSVGDHSTWHAKAGYFQ